jgi:lipopolysaccharide export system protein LptA
MTKLFSVASWLTGAVLMFACAAAVAAQPQAQQPSGTMQGFTPNRDQPVKITANTLEVRDKIHQATFSGDVKLVQGETTVTCRALVVFYEDAQGQPAAKKGAPPADGQQAQKGASQQIKRAEAKGDVMITQKDQTATGDNGVFDVKSNTMTLTGNVVLTQGATVLRGERMVVDMTSGVTKVYANADPQTPIRAGGSRNQIEFMTNPSAKDKPASPASAPTPPPAAKAAPKGPIRIN